MSDLIEKIKSDIQRYGLLRQAATVIVGLSGGADSTALLVALHSLGYRCIAAHCNFHLRGAESDSDALHAEKLARTLGVEFRLIDFNVTDYVSRQCRPVSVEMACRELRYNWFEQLRDEFDGAPIAVAHNSSDNSETLLLNLFRGTGISGLRGMRPQNDRHVIRPMLHCSRHEIEVYLADKGIEYVTDSTNLESVYRRNAVRNEIVPKIREHFPGADDGLTETIDNMLETSDFYFSVISEKRSAYTDINGDIAVRRLSEREPYSRLLLFEWLRPLGFSRQQTDAMIASATSTGKVFIAGDHKYVIDRGVLKAVKAPQKHEIAELFQITEHSVDEFAPERDAWTAYFDSTILSGTPLTISTWSKGDRIKPFGMKGTKKVSDIFNDAKIGADIKKAIPILRHGNDIVWIPGLRSTRLFNVTSASTRYITVRYIGPKLF